MDRSVVEGASPYKLAPGVHGEDEAAESDSDGDGTGGAAGTVYGLAKGQLKRVEGGMEQYAALAGRSAARLDRTTGAGEGAAGRE